MVPDPEKRQLLRKRDEAFRTCMIYARTKSWEKLKRWFDRGMNILRFSDPQLWRLKTEIGEDKFNEIAHPLCYPDW